MNDNQNYYAVHQTKRSPTLFGFARVTDANVERIVEDEHGPLKANLVLSEIEATLLVIPHYPHLFRVRTISHLL